MRFTVNLSSRQLKRLAALAEIRQTTIGELVRMQLDALTKDVLIVKSPPVRAKVKT